MKQRLALLLLCLASLPATLLAAPTTADPSSSSSPNLQERCVGTQYIVDGSIKVTPSATFAIVSYALKKPVKLSTVVFSPSDTPIQTTLGIGSSPVPKTNFTVRVNNLDPGRLYTFKINAPDPECPGKDMVIGNPTTPGVTTKKRKVTFKVTKLKMIDDSDGIGCGDFTVLKALFRLPSIKDNKGKVKDHELDLAEVGKETTICSGDNFFPDSSHNAKVFDNVVDETFTVGFGALDDDVWPGQLASYGWGITWGSDSTSGQFEMANKVFGSQKIPGINKDDKGGTSTKVYKIVNDSPKFEATLYVKTQYV